MKYIITERQFELLSESEKFFFRRRMAKIEEIMEQVISELTPRYFDAEDFEDYKSQVRWDTLSSYEEDFGEIEDKELVEEFFSFTEHFDDKIKEGYKRYKKMR